MTILNQELLLQSERFRTLQDWAKGWSFEVAHAFKGLTVSDYIPPFQDAASLRNTNSVACGILELSLHVLHSDWALDMLNLSHIS
jgi:hypothetical protein